MFRQYYAQRFRSMYPPIAKTVRRKTVYYADPRDRQIGTIPVGTILYIQDGVSPFRGLTRDVVHREPWMVEAWLPRDYAKWEDASRTFNGENSRWTLGGGTQFEKWKARPDRS